MPISHIKKFWVVWNPHRDNPSYRHESKEAALQEAMRLAANNKDEEFIVLEAVHRAKKIDVIIQDYTETGDEIPF